MIKCKKCNGHPHTQLRLINGLCPNCFVYSMIDLYSKEEVRMKALSTDFNKESKIVSKTFFDFLREMKRLSLQNPLKYVLVDTEIKMFVKKQQAIYPEVIKSFYIQNKKLHYVDLKITDYCMFNCKHCYQASNVNGEHGDSKYIYKILQALADLGVREVVFTGGEPTFHPDFYNLLKVTHQLGMIPSFVTRNVEYLFDYEEKIKPFKGNMILSCNTLKDVEYACKLDVMSLTIQLTMGLIDQFVFSDIINFCSKNNIIVGLNNYKNKGRGFNYKPQNYDWWLDEVNNTDINLRFEQLFFEKYKTQILNKYNERYLDLSRNTFTRCYIDAVSKYVSKNSSSDLVCRMNNKTNLVNYIHKSY